MIPAPFVCPLFRFPALLDWKFRNDPPHRSPLLLGCFSMSAMRCLMLAVGYFVLLAVASPESNFGRVI